MCKGLDREQPGWRRGLTGQSSPLPGGVQAWSASGPMLCPGRIAPNCSRARWGHAGPLPDAAWTRQSHKHLPAVKAGSGSAGQGTRGICSPPDTLGMVLTNRSRRAVRDPSTLGLQLRGGRG